MQKVTPRSRTCTALQMPWTIPRALESGENKLKSARLLMQIWAFCETNWRKEHGRLWLHVLNSRCLQTIVYAVLWGIAITFKTFRRQITVQHEKLYELSVLEELNG
jgi:hypothetical protein